MMNSLKLSESIIELLASTAFEAPSILDISNLPIIEGSMALRLSKMYTDEALEALSQLGLRPLPTSTLAEDVYVPCNTSLLFIGRFSNGEIHPYHIIKHQSLCSSKLLLHTHPVPVPIPSPEDIISAMQIGYRIECVLSRTSKTRAIMLCVEPVKSWKEIMHMYDSIAEDVLKVSRYLVAGNSNEVKFLPMPTDSEAVFMAEKFRKHVESYANILHVDIDLRDGVFYY